MKNKYLQKFNNDNSRKYCNKIYKSNSKKIRNKYTYDIHSRAYYLIKGIFVSILISIPIFFIIAIAISFTEFPEEYMPPSVLSTIFISIVIAAFYSTVMAKSKGWFNGTIIGFIYSLILVIIRWYLESAITFNKDILTTLLCGLLIGSVCGIAGLNIGEKIRKTYRSNPKIN